MQDGTKIKALASTRSYQGERAIREHLERARQRVEQMGDPRNEEAGAKASKLRPARGASNTSGWRTHCKSYRSCRRAERRKSQAKARVSTSDPQARVMHHSDGGLSLSYNAQISADAANGLIVSAAVTQQANDSAQLLPAVERMENQLRQTPQQLVADGGYSTRDNIEKMAERGIDFLGSMGREELPSGTTAPQRLPPSAFVYQAETNRYVCPELLRPQGRYHNKKKRGLMAYWYEAKFSDCRACLRKPECCPENQRRGRGVIRRVENSAIQAFREKMASAEAQAQYRQRGESWNFAMPGSRASWVCGSFTCAVCEKCKPNCCGSASPTTCNIGFA